ncbi:hypothetical protein ABZ370_05150 [Streptomyces sp. NPDC005962]
MAHENEPSQGAGAAVKSSPVLLAVAWLWVGIPFAYGLYELALTSRKLFE